MGMTEQEAIEELKNYKACSGTQLPEEMEVAIKALEEVEQYRALGTVEELKKVKEKQIPKKPVKRSFIVPYEGINVCPSCKEPLPSSKEHHCKCGQALDWRVKKMQNDDLTKKGV